MKIFDIEFEEDSDYPIRKKEYKYFQNQSEELNKHKTQLYYDKE